MTPRLDKLDQAFISPAYLTEHAYKDSSQLSARQAIYRFSASHVDLRDWLLDQLPEVRTLIDVGCGNGRYLQGVRERRLAGVAIGLDLSEGMLQELAGSWAPRPVLSVGDAQSLPLVNDCCDVVLALHMLYHVPDISRAVREFGRVLRRGGTLVAVTNGERHLRELDEAVYRCAGLSGVPYGSPSQVFSLENGSGFLRKVFDHVERRDLTSQLRVTEVRPVLDYVATMRDWFEPSLQIRWEQCMSRLETVIQASIDDWGAFEVTTVCGAFFCSDARRGAPSR